MAGSGGFRFCVLDFPSLHITFDKVDHGLLLAKMRSVGLCRDALMWMSSLLDGRRIRTVVDGAMSQFRPTLSGVLHGSVIFDLLC